MYLRLYSLTRDLINPLSYYYNMLIYVYNAHIILYVWYNTCAEYLTFLRKMQLILMDTYVYWIMQYWAFL